MDTTIRISPTDGNARMVYEDENPILQELPFDVQRASQVVFNPESKSWIPQVPDITINSFDKLLIPSPNRQNAINQEVEYLNCFLERETIINS